MAKISSEKNRGMPKAANTTLSPKSVGSPQASVKPGLHTSQKDGSKARKRGK